MYTWHNCAGRMHVCHACMYGPMCMYMYVHVCARTSTHMHMHMPLMYILPMSAHIKMHAHTYSCTHAHVHACPHTYVCMCVRVHMHTHPPTNVLFQVSIHTYACMCIDMHPSMSAYILMHAYAYTYMHIILPCQHIHHFCSYNR
jgi:hypothetical protein